ncbi:unnamed protein product, partial [Rotaria socialis]
KPIKNPIIDDDENDENKDAPSENVKAKEVTVQEFDNITKRLDSMESSVGFVLTKV